MQELHEGRIAATAGEPVENAAVAMIMVHGRGDSAHGILQLAQHFGTRGVAFLAPQASGGTWYPHSFLAPREQNEPWLGSALEALGAVLEQVESSGIPREKTVLLGFSQGACLASEFVASTGGEFGGLAALSGGLIGPPGTRFDFTTSLTGTRAFLGCSDVDSHIPVERVHETARELERLGARVEKRIYPGMGHTVNADEVDYVARMLQELTD